eukprot:3871984-Amphidinium_carterae.3
MDNMISLRTIISVSDMLPMVDTTTMQTTVAAALSLTTGQAETKLTTCIAQEAEDQDNSQAALNAGDSYPNSLQMCITQRVTTGPLPQDLVPHIVVCSHAPYDFHSAMPVYACHTKPCASHAFGDECHA